MAKPEQHIVTKEQFKAWFAGAEEIHERALANEDDHYAGYLRGVFNRIEHDCCELEPGNFTQREHERAWRLLAAELPAWLTLTVKRTVGKGARDAYYNSMGLDVRRNRLSRHIARLHSRQTAATLKQQLAALPAGGASNSPQPALTTLTFPDTRGLKESMLTKSLAALRSDWEEARRHATEPEDNYLLEQIATRWVPDSLRLHQSTRGSADTQGEATELLTRQLRVLHLQVRQLLDRHSDDALTALRAQTAFIEEVGRRGQVSRLALDRDKPKIR